MEGACDGIGKSTQYQKLYDRLITEGYEVIRHHFPSYNTFHGAPVEKYLAGEFGEIKDLNPYFINSLYANDRACAWYLNLKKEYEAGKIILLDRYTTSTLIYQGAAIENLAEREKFFYDVTEYEYYKLGIPKPDMVIFLKAPFELVTKLRQNRINYEGNSNDIHEKNVDFMKQVYDNAIYLANYLNFDIIECNDQDKMKSINEIHELIYDKIKTKVLKK